MTETVISEWQKGGLRTAKLKRIVPEFLEPASLRLFLVAVRKRGGVVRLFNPFTVLHREYVVAATDKGITVLWLRRPGVFRASIGGVVYEGSVEQTDVRLTEGELSVGGVTYEPIAFHKQDAEELARLTLGMN